MKTKAQIEGELAGCIEERERKIKEEFSTTKIDGYIQALEWMLED